MPDLIESKQTEVFRTTGRDEQFVADVTQEGSINRLAVAALLKDETNNNLGTRTNPLYTNATAELFSPLPSLTLRGRAVIPAGLTRFYEATVTEPTAIKEFHVGGRASCEGTLAKYLPSLKELFVGGGFNSAADVASWTNTSVGDNALIPWTYDTVQKTEGTGSAKLVFPKSDANNYIELTKTFAAPIDMAVWRYINADFMASVPTGGAQTRTVQIRLSSGTATRIWQVSGSTTAAPFNTQQWITVAGEIENPTSVAGTGVFDVNNVTSISLRLFDGGNKAGTLWLDDAHLIGSLDILEKIYTSGATNQLIFDPVILLATGDTILMSARNNGTVASEIQSVTSGVKII